MPAVHLYTDDFYDRYYQERLRLALASRSAEAERNGDIVAVAAALPMLLAATFTIVDGVVGPWFLEPYRAAAQEN